MRHIAVRRDLGGHRPELGERRKTYWPCASYTSQDHMPTRETISYHIRRDLADRGVRPEDPLYQFVLESVETMNNGVADLDDELADIAGRLAWLARAPTWTNRRVPDQFDAFVSDKLGQCEASLTDVRVRWKRHQAENQNAQQGVQEA